MKYRRYTKQLLEPLVEDSLSVAEVARKMNLRLAGGSHTHLSKVIKSFGINTSHFRRIAPNKGRVGRRKHWSDILILREHSYLLRRSLLEYGREYKCNECGLGDKWHGEELRLHVEHKNRNWLDNQPENLEFLCPNCHSQTKGFNGSKGLSDVTSFRKK